LFIKKCLIHEFSAKCDHKAGKIMARFLPQLKSVQRATAWHANTPNTPVPAGIIMATPRQASSRPGSHWHLEYPGMQKHKGFTSPKTDTKKQRQLGGKKEFPYIESWIVVVSASESC
jgi:hypothetical protein